jgi:hypothetical protein
VRATRRATGNASLSASARDRILDAARTPAEPAEELFPALFTAPRRLLAAGALPLLLAVGMLLLLNRSATVVPDVGVPSVQATKQGDQVFFRIANGTRDHVVYRSTSPERFEASQGVKITDGSYSEDIDDHAGLVFYRID